MCGALVRARGYQWGEVRERIRASVVAVESDIVWKYVKHCGLQAVLLSNLQLACELPCDHGLYLALGSATCRDEFRRRVDFAEKYQAFAVLDATRSFPVYALGALFGVSYLEGELIARVFASTGLATLRMESWVIERANDVQEGMVLVLHDLQHTFAENLCDKDGVHVARYHATFLEGCGESFCSRREDLPLVYD
jgi:hypothetical protein